MINDDDDDDDGDGDGDADDDDDDDDDYDCEETQSIWLIGMPVSGFPARTINGYFRNLQLCK